MKAGDVSGGRTSSRETWLSAPLSDPNAALWASITPPANRDIPTLVRRRAAAFSLDLLAQRLHLRLPAYFSSRSTARTAILGAAMAFGASVGVVGFLALGALQRDSSDLSHARQASAIETLRPQTPAAAARVATPAGAETSLARQNAPVDDATAAPTTTATLPPTFAANALPMAAEPAISTRAERRAQLHERRAAAKARAKAKRTASAKNKASARRAAKSRRTRAMLAQ